MNGMAYRQQSGPYGLRIALADVGPKLGITVAAIGTRPAALHFFVARLAAVSRLLFLLPLITKPSLREQVGDAIEKRFNAFLVRTRGILAGMLGHEHHLLRLLLSDSQTAGRAKEACEVRQEWGGETCVSTTKPQGLKGAQS